MLMRPERSLIADTESCRHSVFMDAVDVIVREVREVGQSPAEDGGLPEASYTLLLRRNAAYGLSLEHRKRVTAL